MRENDIDLEPDQFGGNLSETLAAALRPANLNRDVATFHPTEFAQPLHECGEPLALDQGRGGAQESDGRQLAGLLRARRERPRSRRAEERDELASLQVTEHSVPSQGRIAEYRISEDQSGGVPLCVNYLTLRNWCRWSASDAMRD